MLEHENASGEMFGLERLSAWLQESVTLPAEEAVAGLLTRLAEYGGGAAFEDDVTVMLVRRT